MAADLEGTAVTVNVLLPGGATAIGMIPDEATDEIRAQLRGKPRRPALGSLVARRTDGAPGRRHAVARRLGL